MSHARTSRCLRILSLWSATLCLLLAGCGGGSSSSPSAKAVTKGGDAIGELVEAYGLVTGVSNVSLARTASENRGISALAPMLSIDGFSFTARAANGYSTLQLTAGGKAKYLRSEFVPLPDGWMARVVGKRSPEVVSQMRQLDSHVGESTVLLENLGQAFNAAKSRAFRQVIGKASQDRCAGPCELSGKITLIAMHVEPVDGGLKVSIRAHANIADNAPLDDAAVYDIQSRALAEYERLGEVEEALAVVNKSIEVFPDDPSLYAAKGRLAMGTQDYAGAAAAFEKALGLEPETVGHAVFLADAYENTGDKLKAATALQKAIALDPTNGKLTTRYGALRDALAAEGETIPGLEDPSEEATPPVSDDPPEEPVSDGSEEAPTPEVAEEGGKTKAKAKGKRRKGKRKKRKKR